MKDKNQIHYQLMTLLTKPVYLLLSNLDLINLLYFFDKTLSI